ncbi:Alpha/Beta hydrolase protein [Crepidotus variabilis]|uniref:Carboxylic ester hydrolase n=1 Tax=Crepidotus variabilis TaxID=179855 RepID=A0A9P6JVM3_9AGAR|nr:Alpha/Beta hydrolase protein [Crepidotus variabilis]
MPSILKVAGLSVSFLIATSFASSASRDLNSSPPSVTLDNANITGLSNGTFSKFLGIPFAQAPIGNLRFRAPQAVSPYNGSIDASAYGPICPQQATQLPLAAQTALNATIPDIIQQIYLNMSSARAPSESLSINIIKPANANADSKLPVLVWIFGGGFERGSALGYDYLGDRLVNRSMELGQPVVYVAMNYRVSAWGFLASTEVQQAGEGNMGLQDQRLALQWIQKYITTFGGDPAKVTIWGQSAGAISASLQMLAYGGNTTDLFHGAIMQSGAPIPVGNFTSGQVYYNQLLSATNCASSNDTFLCLQQVSQDELKVAVDETPNYFSYDSLVLAWSPRADGKFLPDNPQRLLQQGKFMSIPVISGNVDDEGTVFSLSSTNVTTDAQFREYVSQIWVPGANTSTLDPLWSYYPENPADGSPFDTSNANSITPQFKRTAAFQGDVVFQTPRRFFLESLSGTQNAWSYLSKAAKVTPVLGSFHGSDLSAGVLDDYIIRFTYNQTPGNGTGLDWPQYTSSSPLLYNFPSGRREEPYISNDTFRLEPMRYLMNLSLAYPL